MAWSSCEEDLYQTDPAKHGRSVGIDSRLFEIVRKNLSHVRQSVDLQPSGQFEDLLPQIKLMKMLPICGIVSTYYRAYVDELNSRNFTIVFTKMFPVKRRTMLPRIFTTNGLQPSINVQWLEVRNAYLLEVI